MYVDMSEYLDVKIEALRMHTSQFRAPLFHGSPEGLELATRVRGREIGVEAAEGFVQLRGVLMTQVVSVHQPNFMPWLKLLDKVLASDVYVAYDTVKYTSRSTTRPAEMRKAPDGPTWLTVPLVRAGRPQNIQDVRVNNSHRDNGAVFDPSTCGYWLRSTGAPSTSMTSTGIVEDVYRRDHEFLVELTWS